MRDGRSQLLVGTAATRGLSRRRAAVGLVLAALLAGCGQKGPLFLPEEKLDEIKREKEKRDAQRSSRAPGAVRGTG